MTTENNPRAILDWEHPTPPTDLIFDDGEPLESNRTVLSCRSNR